MTEPIRTRTDLESGRPKAKANDEIRSTGSSQKKNTMFTNKMDEATSKNDKKHIVGGISPLISEIHQNDTTASTFLNSQADTKSCVASDLTKSQKISRADRTKNVDTHLNVGKRTENVLAILTATATMDQRVTRSSSYRCHRSKKKHEFVDEERTKRGVSSGYISEGYREPDITQSKSTHVAETTNIFDDRELDKLRRWITAIATVSFDEDTGPELRQVTPMMDFSESERQTIGFSSMPDSSVNELYDSVYSFRFRVDYKRLMLKEETSFLYAYSFFRQRRDPLTRRGGMQEAIVIITQHELNGLYLRMAEVLGHEYFENGGDVIKQALQNIIGWPQPMEGEVMNLHFLNNMLKVAMPINNSLQILETSGFSLKRYNPSEHILAGTITGELLRNFRSNIRDLWACWEVMILGESLVVFADSPPRCSEVVYGLIDLIYPIKYCGDYRPYFTIQDPDFWSLVSSKRVPTNTILGVTNPLFKEPLKHWPNILILESAFRIRRINTQTNIFSGLSQGNLHTRGLKLNNLGGTSGNSAKTSESGLRTKRKVLVTPEKEFLASIEADILYNYKPPWVISNRLRRHFTELTEQFLTPLNRYFSALIPPISSDFITILSSHNHNVLYFEVTPPLIKPWKSSNFFESLSEHGLPVGLIGKPTAVKSASAAASAFAAAIFSKATAPKQTSTSNLGSAVLDLGDGRLDPRSNSGTATDSSLSWSGTRKKHGNGGLFTISDEWISLYSKFISCGNFATWLSRRTTEAQDEIWKRYFTNIANYDFDKYLYFTGHVSLVHLVDFVLCTTQELQISDGSDQHNMMSEPLSDVSFRNHEQPLAFTAKGAPLNRESPDMFTTRNSTSRNVSFEAKYSKVSRNRSHSSAIHGIKKPTHGYMNNEPHKPLVSRHNNLLTVPLASPVPTHPLMKASSDQRSSSATSLYRSNYGYSPSLNGSDPLIHHPETISSQKAILGSHGMVVGFVTSKSTTSMHNYKEQHKNSAPPQINRTSHSFNEKNTVFRRGVAKSEASTRGSGSPSLDILGSDLAHTSRVSSRSPHPSSSNLVSLEASARKQGNLPFQKRCLRSEKEILLLANFLASILKCRERNGNINTSSCNELCDATSALKDGISALPSRRQHSGDSGEANTNFSVDNSTYQHETEKSFNNLGTGSKKSCENPSCFLSTFFQSIQQHRLCLADNTKMKISRQLEHICGFLPSSLSSGFHRYYIH